MSSVNNVGGSNQVQRVINNPIYKDVPAQQTDATTTSRPTDKLELSGLSHLLKAAQRNDIRTDKVAQVKAAIEAGTYEDDQKLDVASDRLLDELTK